jgi:hypothetical protein
MAIVSNASLNSVKIPGIGYIGFETETNSISLLGFRNWIFEKKKDCFDASMQTKCPCNIWAKMKSPDMTKNADLIVAAHRGVWGGYLGRGAAENSKSAINATSARTNVIEVDVMKTADNELILSHDYTLRRLSEYSGPANTYWFNFNYAEYITDYEGGLPQAKKTHLYKLRKRNGEVNNTKDFYLLFEEMLNLLKKDNLVALIDIKELMKTNIGNTCVNCAYDPNTETGREKIKESWVDIFKRCYEVAKRKGLLDYIAFKISYTYDELFQTSHLSAKELSKVRFVPMIQPVSSQWNLTRALNLVDAWVMYPENVVAIETNFKLLNDEYLQSFNHSGGTFTNILHYVNAKGFRPGIFSEEPVGPKGVVNRWATWSMKDVSKDIRGDHFGLMNVPYFKTAVITTDRPDVWNQVNSFYIYQVSYAPFLTSELLNINENIAINAVYKSGIITISGLNTKDINSDIMLYDAQGHLIWTGKVNTNSQMTILKTLPTGVYLLRLSGNRQITIKLITNQ